MPEAVYGRSTRWLTCITIDPEAFGATREEVRVALEAEDIESRPVWKPMHRQPVFAGCRVRGGAVAQDIFEHGLCLPSGSTLTQNDLDRIINIIRSVCRNIVG
jgi:pyridoxal phosphate-dependent aminotransferase EpsN